MLQKFRIHGDNILECEKALELIILAFNIEDKDIIFLGEAAYAPAYRIKKDLQVFEIKLFPGYDRWGINLKQYLVDSGAVLREATDAIVTKLIEKDGKLYEQPILSLEFCGALPAGNNAWQRCGRALASAYAKIPYLYFAEIGGVELDSTRQVKASRFPNPLVPFSYLTLGKVEKTIAIPVFVGSASLDSTLRQKFEQYFGLKEAIILIKAILLNNNTNAVIANLEEYAAKAIRVLAGMRKRGDCLPENDWDIFYKKETGKEKAKWLIDKDMPWHKKIGLKTITKSFSMLLKVIKKVGAIAAGSTDMPFCIIPEKKRQKFGEELQRLYKKRLNAEFSKWVSKDRKPLVCVWIAGFKPRGDDSRPDRGLVPLVRMIFGRQDIDLLTIVYGPAKPITWRKFEQDLWELSRINGLWEAVLGLSDAVLLDTPTNKKMKDIGHIITQTVKAKTSNLLPAANQKPIFGEHDVDSVIHYLFSNSIKQGIYEGLCNPPGGDWSGICMIDFDNMHQYKWTSLPRVSDKGTKRPDHLIQFNKPDILLSIESKDTASTLENGIGLRLKKYVNILIKHQPIAVKEPTDGEWKPLQAKVTIKRKMISGAAFRITDQKDMPATLKISKTDLVFGIEFLQKSNRVIIYVLANRNGEYLMPILKKIREKHKDLCDIRLIRN
jgi:hypothetical protein